jgi:hypothetical protein
VPAAAVVQVPPPAADPPGSGARAAVRGASSWRDWGCWRPLGAECWPPVGAEAGAVEAVEQAGREA